jgi:hypothetical protein
MFDVPTFSQRDPRWRAKKLGNSNLTIGGYGCLLTSLSALISYVTGTEHTPDKVNDDLKKAKAFTGALLIWSRVPIAYPQLKWINRAYNYSNLAVWTTINLRKVPVCVEVNGAKIGAPRHWVLFVGDKKMLDPWVGKIENTTKYPLTGSGIYYKS